jgi:hypothetical protein
LPVHPSFTASSEDALTLREVTERRQTLLASAREHYEREPENFKAASRLAVLLSTQRDDQQRGEREFGMRLPEPVHEPELQSLIQHCERLARTSYEWELVRGLERRTSRQDVDAGAIGSAYPMGAAQAKG